jgi:hypothetical protein
LALALERASEDRSTPTPDPVMAALADRYPGAPAHWLAHVAERTSQLAEVGEAPLSLNSDPAAWPSARPDGLPPPPVTPAEPEPASHQPRRPPLRRDTAVPTLAALRDRSSEVWRRPDLERPRRPRPVFAAVAPASTPERTTATTEADPAPRRPRSPLTFVGSASQAASDAPEPVPPAPEAALTTPPRETTWSQPPQARAATSEAAKAWTDALRPTERPPIDPVFTPARPKDALEDKAPSDRVDARPVVRRHRSWFFAKSRRVERSLDLPADPVRPKKIGRADTVETVAVTRVPQPAFQGSTTDHSVAAPDRIWQDQALPPHRRSLFQKLAALAAGPHARADHFPVSEPTEVRAAPSIDRLSPDTAPRRSASSFKPARTAPSARPAPAFSHPEGTPPSRTKVEVTPRAARRIVRGTSKRPPPDDEIQIPNKRSSFSSHPQTSPSRGASRGFAAAPVDERWPALPPTTFASPSGVEASPARWDVLAREQEEGRWSV